MSKGDQGHVGASSAVLANRLRLFSRGLKRRLRDQADTGDLTAAQAAVLVRLEEHGPATTSALARAEGMRSQSMGSVVSALQTAGLVVGAPDPADGRQTLLSLTDQCREWLLQGRAAREDWLSRTIAARLSAHERDQLAEAMPLLLRLVSPADDN